MRLFDIYAHQANKINRAAQQPEAVSRMTRALQNWRTAVRAS